MMNRMHLFVGRAKILHFCRRFSWRHIWGNTNCTRAHRAIYMMALYMIMYARIIYYMYNQKRIMRMNRTGLAFLTTLLLMAGCRGKQEKTELTPDLPVLQARGVITAVTLNSSTSYFQYKMQPMGYEYDLIADFAERNGLKLEIKVAESVAQSIEMLQNGEADVVAYPVPIEAEDTVLTDVTQLIGRQVHIKPDSRYRDRLENLNHELGGGIHIVEMKSDTLSAEDLVGMVSRGEIQYTICEDDVARGNRTYYHNLDVNLAVSFRQRSSWVVRRDCPLLGMAIDLWAAGSTGSDTYREAEKRYFELSKGVPEAIEANVETADTVKHTQSKVPKMRPGMISPYDDLFKRHAKSLGWDWRLLASIAYFESRFQPNVVAWSGAKGLMGIMPSTARALGFRYDQMGDPEQNIRAGIECLRRFRTSFPAASEEERVKLTLASYNAGVGHINDAQRLAKKYGHNPNVWTDNVAEYIRLKAEPKYYTDSVCRFGYLRGRETYRYVDAVLDRYRYYRELTEKSTAEKGE